MVNHRDIEDFLEVLSGLKLFKSWNVFGTRMFYFAIPQRVNGVEDDGDCRMEVECPWRIERRGFILVGSEDYGLRATSNSDPNWNPVDMQWGHLQDEKLLHMFGAESDRALLNRTRDFVVESIHADEFGGLRICLTGDYSLVLFPTTDASMEWLVSCRDGGSLSFTNGGLSRGKTRDSSEDGARRRRPRA